MKFVVNPVLLALALNKFVSVDRHDSGLTQIELVFENQTLSLIRRDREHHVRVTVAIQEGMDSVVLSIEWAKFANIMRNGVLASDIVMSYDASEAALLITQGKTTKIKIPVLLGANQLLYSFSEDFVEVDLTQIKDRFVRALKLTSIFCKEKIVGRGKYSGVLVHKDRICGSSHEGAFIANCDIGIEDSFGIPFNAVWSILGLGRLSTLFLAVSGPNVEAGKIRSVSFQGETEKLKWAVRFAYIKPAQNFLAQDLHKPIILKSIFEVDALVSNLHAAVSAAQSVQTKADVWVGLTLESTEGLTIRGSDTIKTADAQANIPILGYRGENFENEIQIKRLCFHNVLLSLLDYDGSVTLGLDTTSSCFILKHDVNGQAIFAYNLKEQ